MGNQKDRTAQDEQIRSDKAKEKSRKPAKREIDRLKESIEKVPRTEPLPIVER